jgi:UDP-N-acetylglucosamine:LPS N-acetylglucosamine transferase
MNELYDQADAIITKPGGVTISEALQKGIPIFIHSALPGQEEINLQLLKELSLVNEINNHESLSDQVIHFFKNQPLIDQFHQSLKYYKSEKQAKNPTEIYNLMKYLLESTTRQEQLIMEVEHKP